MSIRVVDDVNGRFEEKILTPLLINAAEIDPETGRLRLAQLPDFPPEAIGAEVAGAAEAVKKQSLGLIIALS